MDFVYFSIDSLVFNGFNLNVIDDQRVECKSCHLEEDCVISLSSLQTCDL